ncbi:MAG: peptidase MA family metallohydrolase [Candidatus Sulfobium sp.]
MLRQEPTHVSIDPRVLTDYPREALSDDIQDTASTPVPSVPRITNGQKGVREKAIALFNKKNYEGAIDLLLHVEDPDKEVLLGTGLCYYKLGDYRKSVSFLRKVLDRDGKNFVARKVIAFAYYRLDDIDASFANARKGLSLRDEPALRDLYERLGRERKARRGYTEEDSWHFRILFDGYEHGGVEREILDILEDAYRSIGQELDYFPPDQVTVILYADRDFYDTTQAPRWSRGIYDGKIRVPVKGIGVQMTLVRKVLFHEYTHVLVHDLASSCPLWLNEGLAEYFSTTYPHKTGQVIPLRNIEKSFAGLGSRSVAVAYRESYSAVSYLIDRYGLYRVRAVLEAFGAGKEADAAFEDGLGVTYSRFISSWGKDAGSS